MQQIRNFFDNIVALSDEDWDFFSRRLSRQEFQKKSMLLHVGQTETYLSFIEKGIVRFFIPHDENDLTFSFAFESNFTSAYDSFLTQAPSSYAVQALSDSVLWRIRYQDLQAVYAQTEAGHQIGRKASESLFLKKARRELSLLSETAEERYLNLLDQFPHLMQNIPLKYLASYIGITPQALSRIRRRIS